LSARSVDGSIESSMQQCRQDDACSRIIAAAGLDRMNPLDSHCW
jgi:hypothetical protein